MKKISIAAIICFVVLFTSSSTVFAQTEQEQRIRSSYMLALGRDANAGEVTYWKGQGNLSIAQLFDRHRQYFMANVGPHRDIIVRSYQAAFGRSPLEGEIKYYLKGNLTYTELIKGHVGFLVRNNDENEKSITRAYQYVLGRKPTQKEVSYGVVSGGLTYLFWVAWLQAPGREEKSIIVPNATVLVGVPVSLAVANEARAASGLVSPGGGNMVAAGGGNMVAAGGGNMVAAGGGNMVAAGGGN